MKQHKRKYDVGLNCAEQMLSPKAGIRRLWHMEQMVHCLIL